MKPKVPAWAPLEFRYNDNVLTSWESAIGNEFFPDLDVLFGPKSFVPYTVGLPFSSVFTHSFGL